MKVLHIAPGVAPYVGGTAFTALGFCEALAAKGLDVTLYTTNRFIDGGVNFNRPVRHKGFDIYHFKLVKTAMDKLSPYVYSPALCRKLRDSIKNFDMVHIHGIFLYTDLIGAYYSRRHNIPYVIRTRGSLEPYALRKTSWIKKIYMWLIERRILDNSSAIHCLSEGEARNVSRLGFKAPLIVVSNGVNFVEHDKMLALKGKFRQRYPHIADKVLILFLGRISPIKGLDRLCRAFAQVTRTHPTAHLVIAGQDNEGFKRQVIRWLKEHNVLDRVTFTGFVSGSEKLSLLVDADIFCLPSYQEGHSLAVKEAMMCGLPVIITNTMNFPEVEEIGAGIVLKTGSSEELSKALQLLIESPSLRKGMGEIARKQVIETLTWDRAAEKMIKEYERLLLQR